MLSRLNIFLAVLLVIVFALPIVTRVNYSKPNYEFIPEMKYSPAWSAYDANPNFADGRTLQPPVSGTIPRGQMPVHFAPVEKEGETPGAELLNPYAVLLAEAETDEPATDEPNADKPNTDEPDSGEAGDNPEDDKDVLDEEVNDAEADEQESEQQKREAEALEQLQASIDRGGNLYRVFCICCHGASGDGKGPVSTRGFPSPTLLTEPVREKAMKDGQLFYILTKGRDTDDWPGSMLPFAGQLSPDQRWNVINYLRTLQERAPAPAAEEAATPAAEDQDTPTTKDGPDPEPKKETDSSDAPENESTTTDSKGQDDVD
jgi:mono/diheme cytochrome c family protein